VQACYRAPLRLGGANRTSTYGVPSFILVVLVDDAHVNCPAAHREGPRGLGECLLEFVPVVGAGPGAPVVRGIQVASEVRDDVDAARTGPPLRPGLGRGRPAPPTTPGWTVRTRPRRIPHRRVHGHPGGSPRPITAWSSSARGGKTHLRDRTGTLRKLPGSRSSSWTTSRANPSTPPTQRLLRTDRRTHQRAQHHRDLESNQPSG
jgi:hypothetical protein